MLLSNMLHSNNQIIFI